MENWIREKLLQRFRPDFQGDKISDKCSKIGARLRRALILLHVFNNFAALEARKEPLQQSFRNLIFDISPGVALWEAFLYGEYAFWLGHPEGAQPVPHPDFEI